MTGHMTCSCTFGACSHLRTVVMRTMGKQRWQKDRREASLPVNWSIPPPSSTDPQERLSGEHRGPARVGIPMHRREHPSICMDVMPCLLKMPNLQLYGYLRPGGGGTLHFLATYSYKRLHRIRGGWLWASAPFSMLVYLEIRHNIFSRAYSQISSSKV